MARPIWSGSISFGLVNVPVKLFSATSPKEVRFHMLHDKDGGRIQQKRVCSIDGEEVPWEHIVKGFEVAKGRYVTVTKEELEAFSPKATRSIDIEDFVELHQIDPIYYDHSYYLVPERAPARGDEEDRQGRDRPVRAADQAVPGGGPADGEGAGALDHAVRRRGGRPERAGRAPRGGREASREGVAHGRAARAIAGDGFRPEEVQGHLPRAGAGAPRAQGGGTGDRRRARRGGASRQGGQSHGRAGEEPRRGPQGRGAAGGRAAPPSQPERAPART